MRSPQRLLLLIGAAFVVAVGAIIPLRCVSSDDGASLELREPRVETSERELRLSTEVASPDGRTQRFRLWYTLTIEGAGLPAYRSATTFGSVEGSQATQVQLTDPINVVAGSYLLDLWVHERDRDDFAHAASRRVVVDLDEAQPLLLRTSAPTDVAVEQAPVTLSGPNPVAASGRVEIRNLSDEPRSVTVAVGLAAADAPDTFGGEAPPTTWSESRDVVIEPESTQELLVDDLVPVAAGRYRTRIEVRHPDGIYDDAIVPDTVEVSDSSPAVVRDALPSGDLMITDAIVPTEWIDTQRQDIAVSVLNMSRELRVGRVFLSLAPASVDEPWGVSRARCTPADVEVQPRQTITLSISCAVASPVDDLIMSIWVHQVTADDTEHNDGVVASSPTTVVPEPNIEHRADRAVGAALVATIAGPSEVTAGDDLVATTTIENLTGDEIEVEVWWILHDVTAEPDDDPLAEGDRRVITLAPGERREIDAGGDAPETASTYQLSIAVHTRRPVDGELVHGDQAWAVVPLPVLAR